LIFRPVSDNAQFMRPVIAKKLLNPVVNSGEVM